MASSQPHLLNTAAREAFEPTCIDQCVCCVFTSADHVNLILTRGSYIDVYTVDECALQTRLRGSSRYQPADPAVKDALDILNSTGTSRPSNRSYRQFEKEHTDVLASYLTSLLTSPENQTDNPILIKTASFNSLGKVESLAVYRQQYVLHVTFCPSDSCFSPSPCLLSLFLNSFSTSARCLTLLCASLPFTIRSPLQPPVTSRQIV